MYLAGYIVTGFLVAGVYASGGCAGAGAATSGPRSRSRSTVAALAAPVQVLVGDWAAATSPSTQPVKLAAIEGLGARRSAARPMHVLGWYTDGEVSTGSRSRKLLSLLAYHDPNATVQGLDAVPAGRPAAGQRRRARLPDDGRHRHAARAARRRLPRACGSGESACPSRAWFYRAVVAAGPLSRGRADRRLGHDRGRPPAVGRLRRDAHLRRGHRRRRHPGRLRDARRSSTSALGDRGRAGCCGGSRRVPLELAGRAGGDRARHDAPDECRWSSSSSGSSLYAVLAGADFGAGFWQLLPGGGPHGERVRDHAHHAMAPVWEANHVWLIFVLVVCWTALPDRVRVDHVDARGAALHRRDRDHPARHRLRAARRRRDAAASCGAIDTVFSLVVDPHAVRARRRGRRDRLGPRAGRQRRGRPRSRAGSTRPRSSIGVLAVAMAAYLAAVYLAADAARLGERRARASVPRARARRRASSPGAIALAGLAVVRARRARGSATG